jgi:PAS domain S-box-containing protein
LRLVETLQESEERFGALFEASPWGLLIHDEGRILGANSTLAKIFGYEVSELIGMEAPHLVSPEWRDFTLQRRLAECEEPYEAVALRRDGTTFPVQLCGRAVRSNGHVVRMVAVRELTERKRAEEALRESEERFRTSVENMLDCFGIYSAIRDESGRIVDFRIEYVNGAACANNLMSQDEQVGRRLLELLPAHRETGLFDDYRQVVETDMPLAKESLFYEDDYSGQRLLRAFDIRAAKLGDGFAAAWRDITERKRAEEALRESENKFRRVLDSSLDMVYCLNLKTYTYDYLSPSCKEVLGYSPEEFAALGFMGAGSLVHPDDVQRVLENFAQVRTHPNVEYRFRHKELGYRWMSDSRSVVFDDKGGAAVVGALRDITERKRAEEALRQAELRYRFLFEQAPALYVITRSENGSPIITDCNELFLTTLGYPRVEVLGRPLADFYEPLSRARLLEHGGYRRALEGRFGAEGRQLVTRDGRVVETVLRAVPEFDDGGRTIGTRATYLNITERKRAEEALRESEERFRRLCDATIEGIVIHDGRKILDANQALAAMLGYDVSEIVGRDGLEFVAPGYRGLVEQSILSGYEASYEVLCLRRDGSTFPAEVRGKAIPYDGRLARVVAIRDITERQRAEEALRESEERFRLIAQATSDAIYDCDLVTGRVWWSEGVRALFGYQTSDVGQDVDWWYDHMHPEDRDGVASRTYAAVAGGQELWVEEYRFRRADGSYAYVVDRGYFIYDQARKPLRMIGGLTDITERKRREEALRESEQRFTQVAEASREWIWEGDAGGRYTYSSPAVTDILGYFPEEVVGEHFLHFVVAEEREEVAAAAGQMVDKKETFFRATIRKVHKDGHLVVVESTGRPVLDAEGNLTGYRGVDQDITQRKRTEEALRQSEERFRLIAQATSDAIWDWDLVTGRVWRGDGMLTLFGHAPSETEPRITWWYDRIHPGDKDRIVAGLHAAIQDGREFWHDEYRFQRADGSYAYVEDRGYVIRDAHGRALRMTGGMTDATERKRAEEALRESERLYRLLAENVTDVIWTMDTNLRTTHISPSVTHLRGYSVEEAMAQTLEEVVTPASFDIAMKALAEELAAESAGHSGPTRSRTLELEVICKDGATVWAEATTTFLRDDDGRAVGILGVSRDISERKRAQTVLEESEKRYRLLANNASDIIATRDLQLRATYMSPAVTDILGYTVEEAMAKPIEELLTPASLEVARKVFAEELAAEETGQRDPSRSVTLELENICRDGSKVWLEVRMTALHEGDGRAVGILGVSRDISERRRAQTALEESEKRYRLLAENATDIIWITDSNLKAVYINPAVTRIRGFSVEEILAHTPEEALTPASVEVARSALAEALVDIGREDSPRWWTLELEHTCKDGSTVWLETTATALCDEQGRLVQFLGVSRDISERKRAEEALQEAREELESRVERRMRRGSAYGLTFRELTVLHLVVAGKSDKEIAAVLGISALTASKHLGNILRRMGAASRTEAGVRALREGLLDSREARP